ncbi:co-chaperone YbbN [Parafrankia sp. EUN1f]|uniref:thioredoxin family protein n=1 Tax=Parafrankia sp. EUN1f TaxID=102897 RepID=UPI0001C439DC|nr:thioredoxin domain-containing protein [Parafrankia sp. EUN1f]EFC85445.1 Thioredoxin domain protein [Parafrankia sp. EUN1f]
MNTSDVLGRPDLVEDDAEAAVRHADDETFGQIVLGSPVPVLVDFHADWCPPCRLMRPILGQIAAELAGRLRVVEVDVDASPKTALAYGVLAMPTMVVVRDGVQMATMVGARSRRRLLEDLAPHL